MTNCSPLYQSVVMVDTWNVGNRRAVIGYSPIFTKRFTVVYRYKPEVTSVRAHSSTFDALDLAVSPETISETFSKVAFFAGLEQRTQSLRYQYEHNRAAMDGAHVKFLSTSTRTGLLEISAILDFLLHGATVNICSRRMPIS